MGEVVDGFAKRRAERESKKFQGKLTALLVFLHDSQPSTGPDPEEIKRVEKELPTTQSLRDAIASSEKSDWQSNPDRYGAIIKLFMHRPDARNRGRKDGEFAVYSPSKDAPDGYIRES